MKIVYCTDSICYTGGIQIVTICKANALAQIAGNEVWIIVTDDKARRIDAVSDQVHVINLDINYYADDWKSRFHQIKGYFVKRRKHRQKLEKILNEIAPDILISTGTSEKNFLGRLKVKSNPVRIREIHFTKNYRLLSAKSRYERIMAHLANLLDYHHHIHRYDTTVVLTQEDKIENWQNAPFITVIPNPVTHAISGSPSSLTSNIVITAGRLTEQKNFQSLIQAWRMIAKKHPNWECQIWGNGNLQQSLQDQITQYGLQDKVILKGYSYQILNEMRKASIFTQTSKFEGLSLAVLEAMSCGLPVVAYTCPTGIKENISDGINGFGIPVGDEQALAEKICYLIEHEEKRKEMGKAALKKAQEYTIEKITQRWMDLFNNLLAQKRKES